MRYASRADASLRLLCFPYAGGSASVFRPWALSFPADVEVCAVEYPGRGARIREPCCTTIDSLVADLTPALAELLDKPFAVLGYSMGSLVAFEWVRALLSAGGPAPRSMIVCARRAPHVTTTDAMIHSLPDQELVAAVGSRYGNAIPDLVLREPELLARLLPILRSDLCAFELYSHRLGPPFAFPIHAIAGERDRTVSRETVAEWVSYTSADFTLEMIPAAHIFLASHGKEVGEAVYRRIRASSPA